MIVPVRLKTIISMFFKHRLDLMLDRERMPKRFKFVFLFTKLFKNPSKNRAIRIRECLEELGPIFIKFGQLLSTRPDLIPNDIAKELVLLQDSVPPFCAKVIKPYKDDSVLTPVFHSPYSIVSGSIDQNNTPVAPLPMPINCLLYTSPSPRDKRQYRMPSSA